MTIQDVHNWLDFVANKPLGAFFSLEEIDNCLDRAQMEYFNSEYAVYAMAQKIQDSLSPFKASYNFLTEDSTAGLVSMPSTYMYFLGGQIVIVVNGHTRTKSLKVLSEDELAYRLDSQLRPVTVSSPVATIAGKVDEITKIQLYPKQPMAGTMFYLRRPAVPKFAYTQTGRVITYDPDNSVQLEWGESEIGEIMIRALVYLGVNASDANITQFSDAKSKEVN